MATLLIEMPSGVAGDMLLAALLDLGGDPERLRADLAGLGVDGVALRAEPVAPGGIRATRVHVDAPQEAEWAPVAELGQAHGHGHGHHAHRPYRAVRALIERAALPERARARALRAFRLLAEAEAAVHGVDPEDVHFHEVGSLDAIVDVVGTCLLCEQLAADRVLAGPFTLGSGTVRCAHGRMPVPVPAVVELLRRAGAPQRRIDRETGELTTPTGAALVCALADAFAPSAAGAVQRVGYGAGHKEIPGLVNLLRASLCDGTDAEPDVEPIVELRCSLDDATPEHLAWLVEEALHAGARECYCTPVVMKKGRPGHELTVLCAPAERGRLAALLLERSPTIGVRWSELQRRILPRRTETVAVDGHEVRLKVVALPGGAERAKPEADDVAVAARALGLSFDAVARAAEAAWASRRGRR